MTLLRTPRATGFLTAAALVAAPLALVPSTAQAADPVVLNLLAINDFHGRVDGNTTRWATTVEGLRTAGGEANTLFISAGDNIGASLFASAFDNDNPTIDVMNAIGLDVTATGNHEFDKGFADLSGRVSDRANFDILGANVYEKGTTTPALDEYAVHTKAGIRVGVVGVVTSETPSLVSPAGITTLDFGDPVVAINRVADQLTDGNEANGEADVVVASLHEGAAGTTTQALIDEANGTGAFHNIVANTSPKVAAIITGHTHKEYTWDAPLPGAPGGCTTGTPGCTRPMVQTGEYGNNIGRITLSVDPDTKAVTAYSVSTTDRGAVEDLTLPRVAAVKTIVDAALAAANEVGKQPVGQVSKDITTAYATGSFVNGVWTQPNPTDPKAGRDDRASESTLGHTVADALVSTLGKPEFGSPTIGVANPGGLRDELFYAGDSSETNKAGVVTYAEANAVLPFVNNLCVATLTGAQFKLMLEQQWQRNPDNSIPQRSFLLLGLSKNVKVVLDPTQPEGSRVMHVWIDGQPLSAAKTYKIATLTFLCTGGDNFRAFTQGSWVDTGLVDREAWIEYLQENKPISPDFTRRQVYADGVPATITAGQSVTVDVSKVNLTSLGTPETTKVSAYLRPSGNGDAIPVGTYDVTADSTTVAFTAPEDLDGTYTLTLVSNATGVFLGKQLSPLDSVTNATVLDGGAAVAGTTKVRVLVNVVPGDDGAAVDAFVDGKKVGTGVLADNAVTVTLDPFTSAGTHEVSLRYAGGATTKPSSDTVTVNVSKATPTVTVAAKKTKLKKSQKPRLTITVAAPGLTINGFASVTYKDDVLAVVTIANGTGKVKLPAFGKKGKKKLTVTFLGDANTTTATAKIKLKVV